MTEVTFNLKPVGARVALVGSCPELGSWDISKAIELDQQFQVKIKLPADIQISYKYIIIQPDGSVIWEKQDDRTLNTISKSEIILYEEFNCKKVIEEYQKIQPPELKFTMPEPPKFENPKKLQKSPKPRRMKKYRIDELSDSDDTNWKEDLQDPVVIASFLIPFTVEKDQE